MVVLFQYVLREHDLACHFTMSGAAGISDAYFVTSQLPKMALGEFPMLQNYKDLYTYIDGELRFFLLLS